MDVGSRRERLIGAATGGLLLVLLVVIGVVMALPDEPEARSEFETIPGPIDSTVVSSSALPSTESPGVQPPSTPDSTFVLNSDHQPLPPITAAFFYPWFPDAWAQRGVKPYTNFTPSLGLYESSDDAVVARQEELAASAGIDAFIASWWGQGHHTDVALRKIFSRSVGADSAALSPKWAIYYEEEGQSDPTVTDLVADLEYLRREFFDNPAYLRVDGRPVVFVWATGNEPDMTTRWARAKERFDGDLYVVLKVYSGYRSSPDQPDSWHQYGPATAYSEHLPYSVTVSPGFHKVGEAPRLERDPTRFSVDASRMAASGATWHLITSWNEWGEGTSIEPADEWGTAYLDILAGGDFTTASTAPPAFDSGGTVVFAAGGDIGATEETTATLQLIRDADPDFFLALGDLSYSDLEPESAWCNYITAQLGPNIPVELVVGNHEDDDRPDGWIGAFADCLPDRMGKMGIYPAQYLFDVGGIVRIVVLGAGNSVDGVDYDYQQGSSEYGWLQSAIDGAREESIPWVIVAMHKNCITVGQKSCEIGQDLVDLLTENRVDLVLQGHDHTYQRSHQLRCAIAETFDPSCIADSGIDGTYRKDSGTVIVISGVTGGGSLYRTDENDAEAGYMTAWMGGDDGLAGRGYVLVSVSTDKLTVEFKGSTTDFTDEFSIRR